MQTNVALWLGYFLTRTFYSEFMSQKATRHVKIIPPYRPVPASSSRSVSPTGSPDKLALQGENNKTSGGGNSGSGGEGSSKSCSSSATSLSAGPGQGSTLQNSCSEGGKPNNNNNISLDINSSYSSKMNSNKNVGKKSGGGYHGMGGNKSLSNAMLDNISGSGSSASRNEFAVQYSYAY